MATKRKRPRTRFIETQDELARSPRPTIVGCNPVSSHNPIPIGPSISSYDSVLAKANPAIPPPRGMRHNSEKRLQIAGNSSKEDYKTFFTMILGRSQVDAAYRTSNIYGAVEDNRPKSAWLKGISGENAENQLQISQSIGHKNFVRQLAVYKEGEDFVVAYEFVPMSLSEVVANISLSGSELATILKQVIGGLLYLEQHGLCHAQLTCSDILISHEGNVKIWGHQYYRSQSSAPMVAALCVLTAQLMSGREGIQQPETASYGRWQDHADFVAFFEQLLAARSDQSHGSTATKSSLEQLSQHPFLTDAPPPDSLEMFLHFVRNTTRWIIPRHLF